MKKSLVALAVIGASAGTAAAQTNVTLYGIADVGIGMADTDAPGSDSVVHVFSGVQSSSRFGIRGSEDLGNGLKATFNIEAGVNWDTGSAASNTQFWGRRAVVGLAGSFGEVRLGRDYTPGYSAIGTTDVMGLGLFGNWLDYGGNGGITSRASNGLHYTGKFGNLTLRAMYATGEADGVSAPKGSGDMYGLSGVYAAGPLTAQAYYQSREFNNGAGGTDDADEYGLGAQYRFGAFRVALNYGMVDSDVPGGGSVEHEALNLGLGVKLGTGEVLFNYTQQELDVAGSPEARSFGIAYVHPLSKRTNLYATYGQMDNKDGAGFGLRSAGFGVSGGANAEPKAFAVGIRHRF
ncbi:MAG: porin [Burkholderiaceae bacterium]